MAGQTATFTVAATGTAPLQYQWRKNQAEIKGATSASYTTPALAAADDGTGFQVVVSNSAGVAASLAAFLTVLVPPVITTQPASQTVNQGQAASFTVAANGTGPLAYQWWKNGIAIPGATAPAYVVPAVVGSDSGSRFSVTVSNSAGAGTSLAAALTVSNRVSLLRQAAGSTAPAIDFGPVLIGTSRTQIVTLLNSDTIPLSLSQTLVGSSFAGGFSSPLVLMPGQSASAPVTFTPNAFGNAQGALFIVGDLPVVVQLTGAGAASHYARLTWHTAQGDISYNVYRGAQPGGPYEKINLQPVSEPNFLDPNVSHGATYFYTVTALGFYSLESDYSREVQVVVPEFAWDLSTIVVQPADQTVSAGEAVTFSVVAKGANLSYQWLKNGVVIPGATGSSYTIPAVSPDDDGSAFVVIINAGTGSVTSSSAVLTVAGTPVPLLIKSRSH